MAHSTAGFWKVGYNYRLAIINSVKGHQLSTCLKLRSVQKDTDDKHPWLRGGELVTYRFSLQSAWEAHPEADDTCHLKLTLPFGHWPLLPRGPDPTCPWETHVLCLSAALSWILVPETRCVGSGQTWRQTSFSGIISTGFGPEPTSLISTAAP